MNPLKFNCLLFLIFLSSCMYSEDDIIKISYLEIENISAGSAVRTIPAKILNPLLEAKPVSNTIVGKFTLKLALEEPVEVGKFSSQRLNVSFTRNGFYDSVLLNLEMLNLLVDDSNLLVGIAELKGLKFDGIEN